MSPQAASALNAARDEQRQAAENHRHIHPGLLGYRRHVQNKLVSHEHASAFIKKSKDQKNRTSVGAPL